MPLRRLYKTKNIPWGISQVKNPIAIANIEFTSLWWFSDSNLGVKGFLHLICTGFFFFPNALYALLKSKREAECTASTRIYILWKQQTLNFHINWDSRSMTFIMWQTTKINSTRCMSSRVSPTRVPLQITLICFKITDKHDDTCDTWYVLTLKR